MRKGHLFSRKEVESKIIDYLFLENCSPVSSEGYFYIKNPDGYTTGKALTLPRVEKYSNPTNPYKLVRELANVFGVEYITYDPEDGVILVIKTGTGCVKAGLFTWCSEDSKKECSDD